MINQLLQYSAAGASLNAANVSHSSSLSTGLAAGDYGIAMALAGACTLLILAAGFLFSFYLGARVFTWGQMSGQAGYVMPFALKVPPAASASMPEGAPGANGEIEGNPHVEEPFESPEPGI